MTREHKTFCRYCIATCGLVLTVEDGVVSRIRGDRDHPLSAGHSCPKGLALGLDHSRPDRLNQPRMRGQGAVGWDAWYASAGSALARIRDQHGPDAIAVVSGAALSSDAAGRWATDRFFRLLGSQSRYSHMTVDTPCKPLMSRLMAGTYGLNATLDQDGATLVVLIGMNPVVSHGHASAFSNPVVQLKRLAERGELWVIDPVQTESARLATEHMAPVPGSEYALLAWLVRELLHDGADQAYLRDHAQGIDELRSAVARYDLATAAGVCGLPPAQMERLLAAIRRHKRVAIQTGTGTTFSETANLIEWMTWALSIVTGSYDRPGGMWFNPSFYAQLDRRSFGKRVEPEDGGPRSRPDLRAIGYEHPGAALCDQIESGEVKAVVLLGNNILTSYPDTERTRAALARLDTFIVGELVHNEQVDLATHAAPLWSALERSDLNIYLGRSGQCVAGIYTEAVLEPQAERQPLWRVLHKLGEAMGLQLLPDGLDPDTASNDDVLRRACGKARVSFDELRAHPTAIVAERAVFGWVHEQVLPQGRWTLAPPALCEQLRARQQHEAAPASTAYPLRMVPRRQFRHYNSQLAGMAVVGGGRDEPDILMHPDDAQALGVSDGMPVHMRSSTGEVTATARTTPALRRGVVSFPHGFAAANVSMLTTAREAVDPLTGMVRQGGIPVRIEPATPTTTANDPHQETSP